ncbi:hypothetical protein, conserved in T. vivax [Trypanosoma vivax Y486]|uniref:Uncharacterized protein n=1 Tax=Trypanosoma vivax (strain Y486) TaxID=1055687 RepID=F9WM50_TRYVY|nr:hypothetical protein, conserved in T. vivax [Trypanosoma vivax Y486]|eukprot:CCD18601.1 hypothetical protein, conserved in T. vivax [Trypanosoma vivax Y486]
MHRRRGGWRCEKLRLLRLGPSNRRSKMESARTRSASGTRKVRKHAGRNAGQANTGGTRRGTWSKDRRTEQRNRHSRKAGEGNRGHNDTLDAHRGQDQEEHSTAIQHAQRRLDGARSQQRRGTTNIAHGNHAEMARRCSNGARQPRAHVRTQGSPQHKGHNKKREQTTHSAPTEKKDKVQRTRTVAGHTSTPKTRQQRRQVEGVRNSSSRNKNNQLAHTAFESKRQTQRERRNSTQPQRNRHGEKHSAAHHTRQNTQDKGNKQGTRRTAQREKSTTQARTRHAEREHKHHRAARQGTAQAQP